MRVCCPRCGEPRLAHDEAEEDRDPDGLCAACRRETGKDFLRSLDRLIPTAPAPLRARRPKKDE